MISDPAVIGALAFILGLIVLVLLCAAIVHGLQEWAWQREQERRYADEWVQAHRAHQHDGRHTHHDERRPE